MTARRPLARLLLRTLVVFGGAGAFLVLGAAVAGAADAPAPAGPAQHALPLPHPEPSAVAVPVPPALAPLAPAVPTVTGRVPGLSVTVGDDGLGLGVEPTAPVPPVTSGLVPDPVPGLDAIPAAGTAPTVATSAAAATVRAHGRTAGRQASQSPHATATPTLVAPAPTVPTSPPYQPFAPLAPFAFALAAIGSGGQLPSRRGGTDDLSATPARARVGFLVRLGVVPRVGSSPPRPGFALLFAPPG